MTTTPTDAPTEKDRAELASIEDLARRGTPEELAADLEDHDDDDPDGFAAIPLANQSQRDPEERLADALVPPPPFGEDRLENYDDGNAAVDLEEWTIEDLDGATWAARKLHLLRKRRAELKKLRDDQKSRLERWFDAETAAMDADARFFEGRLETFHRAALAHNPRDKTIKLPDGSVLTSLAGKLAVEVTSMDELIAWAEQHELADELLRYPDPEPKKVELAGRFKTKAEQETEPGEYPAVDEETGEVIPGIHIERKPRTYSVKGPADEDKR